MRDSAAEMRERFSSRLFFPLCECLFYCCTAGSHGVNSCLNLSGITDIKAEKRGPLGLTKRIEFTK